MTKTSTTLDRLAQHVRAENKARVGYDYPGRQQEIEWVQEHLPQTRTEFCKVVRLVHKSGWGGASELDVAALLLHTRTFTPSTATSPMLCKVADRHRETARKWQVPVYGDPVTYARPRRKRPTRRCVKCGRPAFSNANFGPACHDHYDELS